MASNWWNSDDQLVAMLDEALQEARAVPPEFIEAGKAAYTWRGIDAELAALTYDSEHEPALTRTDTAALRALTFCCSRLTIELEIIGDGLIGQLVPAPGAVPVELETRSGVVAQATADELGCFTMRWRPSGPFRLRCQVGTGPEIRTSWTTL